MACDLGLSRLRGLRRDEGHAARVSIHIGASGAGRLAHLRVRLERPSVVPAVTIGDMSDHTEEIEKLTERLAAAKEFL